jgi:TatD DNase family protein
MLLIDTHSHIYLPEFDNDLDEVIKRSADAGVGKIILPNIDTMSIQRIHKITSAYPDYCIPLMGLHPTSVKENFEDELSRIFNQFVKYPYKGIGEIGIDLYWDKTYIKEQIYVFEKQLLLALQNNLPVVIHARNSFEEIFTSVSKTQFKGLRGIFHAFTGNTEQAKTIIDLGFKIGIGGILTYKNSGLDEIVKSIDLQHIVLETDSPYLAPVPFRGKRNESCYIVHTAKKLAEIKNVSPDEIFRVTTINALDIFRL